MFTDVAEGVLRSPPAEIKASKFVPPDEWYAVLARASRIHSIDEGRKLAIAYIFSKDGEEHIPIAEFDEEQLTQMVTIRRALLQRMFANWEDKTSFYGVLQRQTDLLEEAALKLHFLTPKPAAASAPSALALS